MSSQWNIFITGCNSGIGLGLVKQLLTDPNPPTHLFATCRDINRASELSELSKVHQNLHILILDVADFDAYPKIRQEVEGLVGPNGGLNVLINNAGMPSQEMNADGTGRGKVLSPDEFSHIFRVNTIAPFTLTRELLPLLKKGSNLNENQGYGFRRGAVVMMSSALGSISDNGMGGGPGYRASKCALNMIAKNLAIEYKDDKILVVSVHPGWVKTKMGGPNALVDTDTCTKAMLETFSKLKEENSGTFIKFNGDKLPW